MSFVKPTTSEQIASDKRTIPIELSHNYQKELSRLEKNILTPSPPIL